MSALTTQLEAKSKEEKDKAAEKEAKRLRLRAKSIQELVKTEIDYVDDLQNLTKTYIEPLHPSKDPLKIINEEQHRLLFNNIPSLIALNTKFKLGLETIYADWDPSSSKIAPEFLQFAPYFNMYQGYLNSHEQAAALVSKLKIRSSKFKKFIDNAQLSDKRGLDLSSYLVKPLQRITKYTLLLRELIKHTLPTHPDYNDLQTAMAKINDVNITINEKMKTFDQRQKVLDIQARFTQNVDIVSPSRYFIKEGKLSKICRKKDVEYIFILFSDLLIYGIKASNDSKDNFQIKIHQQIDINQSFRIRDIPQNIKYGAKCWEIHSPMKSFIVYADHPGLKKEWFEQMQNVIAQRSTIESGRKKTAALWVPDDFTKVCMMPKCENKFTVINRRHHCRYCGRLVCGPCSTQKLPHWEKTNKNVRVCTVCFDEYGFQIGTACLETNGGNGIVAMDDDDSMSAGSEIDFEYWDSESEQLDGFDFPNLQSMDEQSVTKSVSKSNGNMDVENDEKKEEKMFKKSKSIKRTSKMMKKQQMKLIHARSASMGAEDDMGKQTTTYVNCLHPRTLSLKLCSFVCVYCIQFDRNRGIFSDTAKVFRLEYSHSPKRSTRTIYELMDKDKSIMNGHSSNNTESFGSFMGGSSLSDNSTNLLFDDEKKQQYEKITGASSLKRNSSLNISVGANLTLGMNASGKPPSPNDQRKSATNKRLKIVGAGTLNIEAHPYDHELVSMRLHTFTEIIDWNLDPHSMKPKKKDEYSCYLKALNVLSQTNEILLIRINNKDIMSSLQTILLSLSYYYEAEQGQRDDDDMDSEEDITDSSAQTVSLSKDTTMDEHKAEIERAVFLIENSKKHPNIKTVDVAKFLLAKSCPISVIKHAFEQCKVEMPDEVYELANVPNPKDSQIASLKMKSPKDKSRKGVKKRSKTNATRHSAMVSKRAAKASKMLGTGMHKAAKKIRRSSLDFGRKKKPRPLYLKQSNSKDNDWLPPDVRLPTAENDKRYQEALCQHDNRFCTQTKDKIGKGIMPSDRLDHMLRPSIDSMAQFSKHGTQPTSPFDDDYSAKIASNKPKKKFSMFGGSGK